MTVCGVVLSPLTISSMPGVNMELVSGLRMAIEAMTATLKSLRFFVHARVSSGSFFGEFDFLGGKKGC